MDPNEQQNTDQPQVVKPEQMFNPSVPYQPPEPPAQPTIQSTQPPTEPIQNQPPRSDGSNKRKILIFVIAGLVGLFIIMLIIVILTSSGDKKNQAGDNQNNQTSGLFNSPSALDIQNANNSITSDITSLNDDNDFPTANLTDTSLHL